MFGRCAVLSAMLLFSACGEPEGAPPPEPAAPAVDTPPSLRFDGLYRSEPPESNGSAPAQWLRFYPDGRVIEATTTGSARPAEVATWLDVGHPDAPQRGRFLLAQEHVRIETRSPASHQVSMGVLGGDGMTLEWHDRTRDVRETRRFRFAPIPAWASSAR